MQSRLRSIKNIKSTRLRDQGHDQTRLTRDEAQTAAGTIAVNKVKRNTTANMSDSSKKSPHLKVVVKQLSLLRLKMSWDRTWHCIVIVSVRLKKLNDSGKRIDKTPMGLSPPPLFSRNEMRVRRACKGILPWSMF